MTLLIAGVSNDGLAQESCGPSLRKGDSGGVHPARLADFQPGDLLFFGFRGNEEKKERVTHVGISLGGRRFIHCSSDVHINSLDPSDVDYSDRRRQMFLRARRVIGAGPRFVERLDTLVTFSGVFRMGSPDDTVIPKRKARSRRARDKAEMR